MPALIEHIDAIARREQRDVLYLEFHPADIEAVRGYRYAVDPRREMVLQWLAEHDFQWALCGPYADGSGMQPYLGQIYIDTAYDVRLPKYRQLRDYMEFPDGKMRWQTVRFYVMPLAMANNNAQHDEPDFWSNSYDF